MLPRPLTLVILISTVTSHTKRLTQAEIHGGDLEVNAGENLTIDTSGLTAIVVKGSNVKLNISLGQRNNNTNVNGHTFSYSVAVLTYTKDIILHKDSLVKVEGNRSLLIESIDGNIYIGTNISMTCEKVPDVGDTCLGGYMVNKTQTYDDLGIVIYTGIGPGGSLNGWTEHGFKTYECIAGAGHGGNGGRLNNHKKKAGQSYGLYDFHSLMGGSSGSFDSPNITYYGGGAVEIRANKHGICIDSSISASAADGSGSNSSSFSGSSGGLIRLVANEVEMTESATLKVDGSGGSSKLRAGAYNSDSRGNGGGGGGIIQVIASRGHLFNLSLSSGNSFYCNFPGSCELPQPGCLIYKEPSANRTVKNCTHLHKEIRWPEESGSQSDSVCKRLENKTQKSDFKKGLSIDEQLTYIKNQSIIIKESKKYERVFVILEQLSGICSQNNLTQSQLVKVLKIFEVFTDILKELSQRFLKTSKDVYTVLLEIATAVMSSRNQRSWKETKNMPTFVQSLEDMAAIIANVTPEYYNCTDLIDIQITTFNATSQEIFLFPIKSKLSSPACSEKSNFIEIPKSALPEHTGIYTFIAIIYKKFPLGLPESLDLLQKDKRSTPHRVGSELTSYRLLHKEVTIRELKKPGKLHFQLHKDEYSKTCAFWNNDKWIWDVKGLSLEWTNASTAICKTSHLTSFAVLMQFTKTELTKEEELSISIITYVGCALSILSLLATTIILIVFIKMEALTTERHRIHLNLAIALLISLVLFLGGIKAKEEELTCRIIAGLLHYFYLAAFAWMLVEGVHLYLKVVRVFGVENVKVKYYCAVGWVLPLLIVLIPVIFKPYNYGTKYACWLSLEDGFVWAFIGPVLGIIAINFFILGLVVKTVVMSASTTKSSDYSHIKAGVKSALVLMPLMGVTWIFGLLAVNRNTIIFQYLFAITNSLQGVFIFLLHIVFNNEVRTAFMRRWERRQLSKESADYNASYTSTHERSHNASEKSAFQSSSSNNVKSRFAKLKAPLSFSMMPRTSKVVSVQPYGDNSEGSMIHVDRKLDRKVASNRLSPEQEYHERTSSLNCPMSFDDEPSIPVHDQLRGRPSKKIKDCKIESIDTD